MYSVSISIVDSACMRPCAMPKVQWIKVRWKIYKGQQVGEESRSGGSLQVSASRRWIEIRWKFAGVSEQGDQSRSVGNEAGVVGNQIILKNARKECNKTASKRTRFVCCGWWLIDSLLPRTISFFYLQVLALVASIQPYTLYVPKFCLGANNSITIHFPVGVPIVKVVRNAWFYPKSE